MGQVGFTVYCLAAVGNRPKERFLSERAAKRACAHKRSLRNRRWPRVYKCPCGWFHLTKGGS